MEKLAIMDKQIISLHEELRRVKRFHKESSKNFREFHKYMTSSLKILTQGDIYNDIHYTNILNMSIIEYFCKHVIYIYKRFF